MSSGDLPKRGYRGTADRLHADAEFAMKRIRDDINADAVYSPAAAASWAGTAPTTIAQALDRLAAAYTISHAAVPE